MIIPGKMLVRKKVESTCTKDANGKDTNEFHIEVGSMIKLGVENININNEANKARIEYIIFLETFLSINIIFLVSILNFDVSDTNKNDIEKVNKNAVIE